MEKNLVHTFEHKNIVVQNVMRTLLDILRKTVDIATKNFNQLIDTKNIVVLNATILQVGLHKNFVGRWKSEKLFEMWQPWHLQCLQSDNKH